MEEAGESACPTWASVAWDRNWALAAVLDSLSIRISLLSVGSG